MNWLLLFLLLIAPYSSLNSAAQDCPIRYPFLASGGQYSPEARRPDVSDVLNLPVLKPGYFMSVGPLARIGDQPVDIYLQHGLQVVTKIEKPTDLVGYVMIEDDLACLTFLRFFSLPDTNYLFEQDTRDVCTEVFKAPDGVDVSHEIYCNLIDAGTWDKHRLRCPLVREASESELLLLESKCLGACKRGFVVGRTVICPDQKIYWVTQVVSVDGRFAVISKELLEVDGSQVGVRFLTTG